jgi:hypothetical protein
MRKDKTRVRSFVRVKTDGACTGFLLLQTTHDLCLLMRKFYSVGER